MEENLSTMRKDQLLHKAQMTIEELQIELGLKSRQNIMINSENEALKKSIHDLEKNQAVRKKLNEGQETLTLELKNYKSDCEYYKQLVQVLEKENLSLKHQVLALETELKSQNFSKKQNAAHSPESKRMRMKSLDTLEQQILRLNGKHDSVLFKTKVEHETQMNKANAKITRLQSQVDQLIEDRDKAMKIIAEYKGIVVELELDNEEAKNSKPVEVEKQENLHRKAIQAKDLKILECKRQIKKLTKTVSDLSTTLNATHKDILKVSNQADYYEEKYKESAAKHRRHESPLMASGKLDMPSAIFRSVTPSQCYTTRSGGTIKQCPLRESLVNELEFMSKWASKAEEPKNEDYGAIHRQLKGLIRRLRRSLSLTKCVYH